MLTSSKNKQNRQIRGIFWSTINVLQEMSISWSQTEGFKFQLPPTPLETPV